MTSRRKDAAHGRMIQPCVSEKLCLQDRQVVAIVGLTVCRHKRVRQEFQPLAQQGVDLTRGQAVANLLQALGVVARSSHDSTPLSRRGGSARGRHWNQSPARLRRDVRIQKRLCHFHRIDRLGLLGGAGKRGVDDIPDASADARNSKPRSVASRVPLVRPLYAGFRSRIARAAKATSIP
jgi:hypothetical protein